MFLLFLFSCISDQMLTNKIVEERYIYDTAYVEVIVEVEKEVIVEVEVEVEKEVEVEVEVPEQYPVWSQTYIQPTHGNGVDILWVIDPSGSMVAHHSQVLLGIQQMLLALPTNVNWRLEIIPGDPNHAYGLSSFPVLPGDSFSVVSSHLSNNITGHYEKGFDSVKKYVQNNADAQNWMRPDAALLIVFVSDEDDQSSISSYEFITWASIVRSEVFVASIVNVDAASSLCTGYYSSIDIGTNYMDVTNHFGGPIIDICDTDWSSGVSQVAQQVQLIEEIVLDFVPVSSSHIEVFVDNVLYPDWTWDEPNNKIIFSATPPEGSMITVSYNYL